VPDALLQAFQRTDYAYAWYDDKYDEIVEPAYKRDGAEWTAAMDAAKKLGLKHPVNVKCLELDKLRDSEGTMAAYLKFGLAASFRQYIAVNGT
jgi:hypothetical protein